MSLWDLVRFVVLFMILFAWIGLLLTLFGDVLRDPGLSGWSKAGWTLVLLVLPWLGVLVYVVVRGGAINERARAAADRDAAESTRPRRRAGRASTADEIGELADLRDRGVLSAEEFQRAKASALGGTPTPVS